MRSFGASSCYVVGSALSLSAFDCSSDKSVSSGITSEFFTRSQMRLFFPPPTDSPLCSCVGASTLRTAILCVNHMNHQCFTLSSFLSVSLSSAFKPKRYFFMDIRSHTQTHMLLVIPRVWDFVSLQATHSHSQTKW